MSEVAGDGIVLVVAVSSFTKRGFKGSSSYRGKPVDIEFDDLDEGVFLTAEMCGRIEVKKGSKVLVLVESDGAPRATEVEVGGVSPRARISNARVYYEIGREGGAVVSIKRA